MVYTKNNNYELHLGMMQEVLPKLPAESVDAVITDPPYELGFMGKSWDNTGVAFQKQTWEECLRVLKPGGYLLAFGGSRTFHRIACAIEDAGFEIRDTIMWLYGSGFPKSMSISKGIEAKERFGVAGTVYKRIIEQSCDTEEYTLKQTNNGAMGEIIETTRKEYVPNSELAQKWTGWGTCLKPAYEPIIVARKPFSGSLVDNVLENGVGGLNIDECRVGDEHFEIVDGEYDNNPNQSCYGNVKRTPKSYDGRFPANVMLTYDETDKDEVCGGMPDTKGNNPQELGDYGYCWEGNRDSKPMSRGYDDEGSASRYFYCAKASKRDRDEGLDLFESKVKVFNGKSDQSSKDIKDVEQRFTTVAKNIHPTVKPVALMQYLIRLVCPKGSIILDPFNGSGSTGKACMYENKDRNADYYYIGVEMTEEYLPISKARLDFAINDSEPLVVDETGTVVKTTKISLW